MNEFVAPRFLERVTRLALGLEPIDAMQRQRAHRVDIAFDAARRGLTVTRHASGRHVLFYSPTLTSPVDLRITDPSACFVPRRLRIPIHTPAVAETQPQTQRVRRPVLFPGAAYDVSDATGLRGRVMRAGQAMRWARVEASVAGGRIVARAHGDHRGEFLLLVGPNGGSVGDLEAVLAVDVKVMGPAAAPVPPAPASAPLDPLWDLPLEVASAPGAADPVSAGEMIPGDYTATTTHHLDLALGRVLSGVTFTVT